MRKGFWGTIANWFTGRVFRLEDFLADPELDSEIAIAKGEKMLSEFVDKVKDARTETHILEKKVTSFGRDLAKVDATAKQIKEKRDALDKDTDAWVEQNSILLALGREAVAIKVSIEELTVLIKERYKFIVQLDSQCIQLRSVIATKKTQHDQLKLRTAAAKLRTELTKAQSKVFADKSFVKGMQDFADSTEKAEADAQSTQEMVEVMDGPVKNIENEDVRAYIDSL